MSVNAVCCGICGVDVLGRSTVAECKTLIGFLIAERKCLVILEDGRHGRLGMPEQPDGEMKWAVDWTGAVPSIVVTLTATGLLPKPNGAADVPGRGYIPVGNAGIKPEAAGRIPPDATERKGTEPDDRVGINPGAAELVLVRNAPDAPDRKGIEPVDRPINTGVAKLVCGREPPDAPERESTRPVDWVGTYTELAELGLVILITFDSL